MEPNNPWPTYNALGKPPVTETVEIEPFPLPPPSSYTFPTPERWTQPKPTEPPLTDDELRRVRSMLREWEEDKKLMEEWGRQLTEGQG